MPTLQRSAAPRLVSLIALLSLCAACNDRADSAGAGRIADVPGAVRAADAGAAASKMPSDSAIGTLAHASGGDGSVYRPTRDTVMLHAGVITGRVESDPVAYADSAITPTHDLSVCKPFTESPVPASKGGVGNAVVWLVGVESGPVQSASRRAALTLDRCRLEPRVQQMATGGTVMVTSRDAMMSRLRFIDAAAPTSMRAQVMLNDAGQVVPTSDVATTPGLVEVRDDLHPWVHAYIAVSTHPFVAITEPDGVFRFDLVPPGSYTLVAWQEKLGVRTRTVRVVTGVETKVVLKY